MPLSIKPVCLALSLLIVASCVCSQPSSAAPSAQDKDKQIAAALKLVEKNPALADTKLRALNTPTSKVFRAYLYFSNKVKVPNKSALVDQLMNSAIRTVPDESALDEISQNTKYHYKDMTTLLTHLRFITDGDRGPEIPNCVFREYPESAFTAFDSHWGSRRDSFMNVEPYPSLDVEKIREVKEFTTLLSQLFGDESTDCSGTIRYMHYRKQSLAEMQASLAPSLFMPGSKNKVVEYDPVLSDFMESWSNQELWNKVKFKEYMLLKGRAVVALARVYNGRLKNSERANECAKNAIEAISVAYLSSYSKSDVEDTLKRPIYKPCIRPKVTGAELEKALSGVELSKNDLSDGLRFCILNNSDISAIEWLIAKGAPLDGGRESLLFSSVLNPDAINVLLKGGVDVKEENDIGKTAIFQAAQHDSLDAVKVLHKAGADLNKQLVAIDSEKAESANSSCKYNYTVGSRTPLHYACMFASLPVIRYLIENGADTKAKDSSGATAQTMINDNKKLSTTEKEELTKLLGGTK